MTKKEKLLLDFAVATLARIEGEFDKPELESWGTISINPLEDIAKQAWLVIAADKRKGCAECDETLITKHGTHTCHKCKKLFCPKHIVYNSTTTNSYCENCYTEIYPTQLSIRK